MIYNRKILCILITGLSILCLSNSVMGHVDGLQGMAPELSPKIPGIERPFPQDKEKFTFAIIGDKTGGGGQNWPIFDRALDEVNHLHPDFAIMVGDLIQGYIDDTETISAQWKEFYEHANRIQIPFFFVPGNHDISNKAMYEFWRQKIGKSYYSFNYKGCHFMVLNTEEVWKTGEAQFGSEQMDWIHQNIEAHRDSKQIFFFMHRPAWRYSGEPLAQWETIETWLEGLPYTVFAGHFHNLDYETRKDHRYFVLSATGAGLAPSEVMEAGAFHHYTMVTVDNQDVHIAISQPGNIHGHDIAQRIFTNKARQMLLWEKRLPVDQGLNSGEIIARMKNDLDEPLTMSFEYSPADGSLWDFVPIAATHTIQPGEQAEIPFKVSYEFENVIPVPSIAYKISYGDKHFIQGSASFAPTLNSIKKWIVVGPFDIGIQEPPSDASNLEAAPLAFTQKLEPERNMEAMAYASGQNEITWKTEEAEANGWLNFENIYGGDFSIAYGLCYIQSPDARKVLAGFRGDDLSKIIVNGEEVYSAAYSDSLKYISLTLKEGWNSVLVKCADYNINWGYTLQISDHSEQLKFAERLPQ